MNPIIDESVNLPSNDAYYAGIRKMTITMNRIDYVRAVRYKYAFKVKHRYTGTYEVGGPYGLRNQNVVKYVTYYFLGVPVLKFNSKLNDKDWEYILNK